MSTAALGRPAPAGPGDRERPAPTPAAPWSGSTHAEPRSRARRPRGARLALDAIAVGSAMLIAGRGALPAAGPLTLVFALALLGALHGAAPAWHEGSLLDELRRVAGAAAQAGIAVVAAGALTGHPVHARTAIDLWLASAVLLIGARLVPRSSGQGGGLAPQPTLIVGAGRVGRELAARLEREPEHGLQPVGFLDDAGTSEVATLRAPGALAKVVAATGAACIVFAFTSLPDAELLPLLEQSESLRLRTFVVPRLYEADSPRTRRQAVGSLSLSELRPIDPRGPQFALKHLIDRLLSALALVVLAPLLTAIVVLVRTTSPGPALYRQRRVGRDGREFTMLKFRTMRAGDERRLPFRPPPGCAPGGVEQHDRRTRIGTVLRRSSLDELPQLLNVLRGDMSLIGPRPERPEYVRQFAAEVARYDRRHRVKSGITGLAQVSGLRGQTSLAERASLDNAYIQNWSFWLDAKIAVRTVKVMLTFGGV
ncbi:MAG: sugar transferase [Solirubrobacteraceae bacterium]